MAVRNPRATIRDVAQASGVSISAVSRILNGDPTMRVREETRDAVHNAIAALGYMPNTQAKALRQARVGTLGMIAPEIYSPAFPELVRGAQQAASGCGYSLILAGLGADGENPRLARELLQRNHVDGVLLSTGVMEEAVLAEARALTAPAVLLNRYIDESFPHVIVDDQAGAMQLMAYLTGLGHRRVAYLGALDRSLGSRRLAGFTQALDEAGLALAPEMMIETGYEREDGEQAAAGLLDRPEPPTAIIATNHVVAAGVVIAARERGIAVPGGLSVASFYDTPLAELLTPSLTSVRYPLQTLGDQAVRLLVDLIEDKAPEALGQIIPPDGVIVRHSTGPIG